MGESEVGNEIRIDGERVTKDVDLKQVKVFVDGRFEQSFEAVDALRDEGGQLHLVLVNKAEESRPFAPLPRRAWVLRPRVHLWPFP